MKQPNYKKIKKLILDGKIEVVNKILYSYNNALTNNNILIPLYIKLIKELIATYYKGNKNEVK
jgi:hypothetical protein